MIDWITPDHDDRVPIDMMILSGGAVHHFLYSHILFSLFPSEILSPALRLQQKQLPFRSLSSTRLLT
jgi:hypothetical protein